MTEQEMYRHYHSVMTNLVHGDGTIVTDEYINAGLAYGQARRRYNNYQEQRGWSQPMSLMQPWGAFPYAIRF